MSIEPHRTEDSAMSEAVVGADTQDKVPSRAELAQKIDRLEEEKDSEIQSIRRELHEERKKRRELEHDVDFLRDSLFLLQDLIVGEDRMVTVYEDDNPPLVDQILSIQRGEVDPTDVVAAFEPELPIEEDVAKAMDDVMSSDLSANEKRAVHIFRAFGGRSRKYNGVLKVESGDVRNILEEKGESDPNPNTVKRAMKMLAKKTSDLPKEDRDAYDSDNLLTLHKAKNCLELRADNSEWNEYIEEVQERVGE